MRALLHREKFLRGNQPAAISAAALLFVCALSSVGLPGCQAQVRGGDRLASDPHWKYADVSLAEQDLDDAREALNPEGAGDPTSWQGWNDRGILAARSSEILTAEAAFLKAGSADGASVAIFNLARLYVILGEDAEAGAVYRQTLRRGQLSPAELRAKALELESQNRRTEARLAMRAIAAPVINYRRESAAPGAATGESAIAAALWLAGDELRALRYGPARDLYDQVLSLAPQNAAALFGRGYISYLAEDWGGAASLLTAARAAQSPEPELPYYLVRALHQQQRYDEALEIAEQVESPDLRLLELHGRLRLLLDYRAELGDLIQRARPADRNTLRNRWYGAEDLRRLPELDSEFRLLY